MMSILGDMNKDIPNVENVYVGGELRKKGGGTINDDLFIYP